MVTFDKLLEMLADEKVFSFPREKMEEIYGGRIKQKPWKVLNADPNTFYDGSYFYIENTNGKSLVYQQETTYKKGSTEPASFFLAFDVPDSLSPNSINSVKGRFSFQYEEFPKTNYHRILFFFAEETTPKTINNYFKDNRVEFDEGVISTLLNKNGDPEGFAYIYDYDREIYYFASLKDGVPHGFVFSFKSKNKQYVFDNAYIYFEGQKTDLLKDYIDKVREKNKKHNLTVISWS